VGECVLPPVAEYWGRAVLRAFADNEGWLPPEEEAEPAGSGAAV
jgi:hypothetical protein